MPGYVAGCNNQALARTGADVTPDVLDQVKGAAKAALHNSKLVLALGWVTTQRKDILDASLAHLRSRMCMCLFGQLVRAAHEGRRAALLSP
jgi:hypothetical protein